MLDGAAATMRGLVWQPDSRMTSLPSLLPSVRDDSAEWHGCGSSALLLAVDTPSWFDNLTMGTRVAFENSCVGQAA